MSIIFSSFEKEFNELSVTDPNTVFIMKFELSDECKVVSVVVGSVSM